MILLEPLAAFLCLLWIFNTAFAIWPLPMEMELGSNALWLLPDFEVEYGYEEPTGILQNLQNYLMYVRKDILK